MTILTSKPLNAGQSSGNSATEYALAFADSPWAGWWRSTGSTARWPTVAHRCLVLLVGLVLAGVVVFMATAKGVSPRIPVRRSAFGRKVVWPTRQETTDRNGGGGRGDRDQPHPRRLRLAHPSWA